MLSITSDVTQSWNSFYFPMFLLYVLSYVYVLQ